MTTHPGRAPAPERAGLLARLAAPTAVAAAGLGGLVAVAVRDPHVPGSWGVCPFFAVTGYHCPGCGGLRAVHALLNGDLLGALGSNLMGLVVCGLLTGLWAVWFVAQARGRPVPWENVVPSWAAPTLLAFIAVFSVFRNTPWGSWLAPPPLG